MLRLASLTERFAGQIMFTRMGKDSLRQMDFIKIGNIQ